MYFVALYARLNALVTHNILKQEISYPVDTGRKLNVHKTFRRRPGYLMNVLCTFNLRPVSMGKPSYIFGSVDLFFQHT